MNTLAMLLFSLDFGALAVFLVALGVMLVGALIILAGSLLARSRQRFQRAVVTTEGTVLKSVHSVREVGGGTLASSVYAHTDYSAAITARYEPNQGQALEVTDTIKIPAGGPDYFDGNSITVFFDPKNPASAKLSRPSSSTGLRPVLVGLAIGLIVISIGYRSIPERVFRPDPPLAAFPEQIGKYKRQGNPELLFAYKDSNEFVAHYGSPDEQINAYRVTSSVGAPPRATATPDESTKNNTLLQTDNLSVRFVPFSEDINISLQAGALSIDVSSKSLTSANELLNNLPYAQLGVVPPPLPIALALPPPAFAQKPQSDKDRKLSTSVNGALLAIVDLFFVSKRIKSKARINKLDPSTVMTEADIDSNRSSVELAKELIGIVGDGLSQAGFRQLVISTSTYQLSPGPASASPDRASTAPSPDRLKRDKTD